MFKCKICGRSFEKHSGLGVHLKQTHDFTAKEYYDMYFKRKDEVFVVFVENLLNF